MPTSDIPFQVDVWILFGNNEEGMDKTDEDRSLYQVLKKVLNFYRDKSIINSFCCTDRSYQEYQMHQEFEYFSLRDWKSLVTIK